MEWPDIAMHLQTYAPSYSPNRVGSEGVEEALALDAKHAKPYEITVPVPAQELFEDKLCLAV